MSAFVKLIYGSYDVTKKRRNYHAFLCIFSLLSLVLFSSLCYALSESDLNHDGSVDFRDLAKMASQWLIVDYQKPPAGLSTFAATYGFALNYDPQRLAFIDEFNDTGRWTAEKGMMQIGCVNTIFAHNSMRVEGGTDGAYPINIFQDVNSLNFNACTFRLRYYVESNKGLNRNSSSPYRINVCFDSGTNLSKYAFLINTPIEEGVWHDLVWTSSEIAVSRSFNFAVDPVRRIWIRCVGNTLAIPQRPVIYFDRLEVYRNDLSRPGSVIIGLDDAWAQLPDSQFEALKYSAQKGVRAYCAVATDKIGANPNYMTWAQIGELYSTGLVNIHAHYFIPPYGKGETAMRQYLIKAKQDLLDHGISAKDAEVFVIPSGTDGAEPDYIPVPDDILMMKEHFAIVRGTGGFWTGAGYLREVGSSRTRAYMSYDRPQKWWTSACGIGTDLVNSIEDKLIRAKANGTILTIYAHLGVTHDITIDQWKIVIDAIAAAQERGDIVVYSLLDI